MLLELLNLAAIEVATLALILLVLALAFRFGWGVGAWLAGKLH